MAGSRSGRGGGRRCRGGGLVRVTWSGRVKVRVPSGAEVSDQPFAVHDAVVVGAQPGEVGQRGGAAVVPVLEVVGVDPSAAGVAVGEPAALVAHREGVS